MVVEIEFDLTLFIPQLSVQSSGVLYYTNVPIGGSGTLNPSSAALKSGSLASAANFVGLHNPASTVYPSGATQTGDGDQGTFPIKTDSTGLSFIDLPAGLWNIAMGVCGYLSNSQSSYYLPQVYPQVFAKNASQTVSSYEVTQGSASGPANASTGTYGTTETEYNFAVPSGGAKLYGTFDPAFVASATNLAAGALFALGAWTKIAKGNLSLTPLLPLSLVPGKFGQSARDQLAKRASDRWDEHVAMTARQAEEASRPSSVQLPRRQL
jgi:hypothetical protein